MRQIYSIKIRQIRSNINLDRSVEDYFINWLIAVGKVMVYKGAAFCNLTTNEINNKGRVNLPSLQVSSKWKIL